MKTKTADEIRSAFLKYFESHAHRVVRSSPLVPENDPTLLFANAGMNQFKDTFLGKEKRDYARAASSQKCVRAGGKHNDLENVGFTARHHTFFEMLGNFSFGDYFKREAIGYAWVFLTRDLGLPKDRLKVTIFKGEGKVPRDTEAHGFWKMHVPADRILELGAKDNFWAMGDTGPCGPCSEIHFFQGDDLPCVEEKAGRKCLGVECECDRWLEIWNLVFMQYNRDASGNLKPLPAPCIDTGMGLERVTAVVQGQRSNFDTDLFLPILEAIAKRAGTSYGKGPDTDVSLRVVADHLRAMTFLIGDGVMPGNEGRGYVLRKIMRRAMRHGKKLGIEEPFLHQLVGAIVERMSGAYPELLTQQKSTASVIQAEEDRFGATLKQAFGVFEEVAKKSSGQTIGGPDAFFLYDTYGLPLDFLEELASDRGLKVDHEGFEKELEKQRERARQASKMEAVTGDPVYMGLLEKGKTTFLGYDTLLVEEAQVLAVLKKGALVKRLERGEEGEVILDRTPFYGESGGQVGDRGVISSSESPVLAPASSSNSESSGASPADSAAWPSLRASRGSAALVVDCKLALPGLYSHHVKVTSGGFEPGMKVRAEVDAHHRAATMRNHTGTHLLNAALRETLGPHVKQSGSLVSPDRLRFDFSHYTSVNPREQQHIENVVNAQILRDAAVHTQVMNREEALGSGALAFFGDKYGEQVRVVEVPGFSKEFCGGTHVHETGQIGLFLLTLEQGVAAGTRRVEALTGESALRRARADQSILEELEQSAKVDRRGLVDEYAKLRDQLKAQQREIDKLKMKLATGGGGGGAGTGAEDRLEVGGVTFWTPKFEGLDRKAHATVVDNFRNENRERPFVLVSTAVDETGVSVIAAASASMASKAPAPEIMKRLGLRGGGRPDFAQGGGVEPGDVDAMRSKARQVLKEMAGA